MNSTRAPGQVLGTAGFGLRDSSGWAANEHVAKAGQKGEERTAQILDRLALQPGGPTVLHDVTIPGSRANLDHIVVSGNRITLVDSKVWKPARYWTFAGKTRRGRERFTPAETKTMTFGMKALEKYLMVQNVHAVFSQSILLVWPSNDRTPMSLFFYQPYGARAIKASQLEQAPHRAVGRKPADTRIVQALIPLLTN